VCLCVDVCGVYCMGVGSGHVCVCVALHKNRAHLARKPTTRTTIEKAKRRKCKVSK